MKKTIQKVTAVGLAMTSFMGLMGCSGAKGNATAATDGTITKPDKITVMMDATVLIETNGGMEFRKQLEEATGLNIEWIQPDHSGYHDALSNAFNSNDTMPDVCILPLAYYSLYASNGMLWDMTDAWNNSETKKSGRLVESADSVIDSMMVNGEDGKKAMYGFSPYRGNGCMTYVKKSWLTRAGIDPSTIEGQTLTFAQYYDALKKMRDAAGHYVISSVGFVGFGAPYTHFLPEFYQDAEYTFYQNASGKYVDGFSEDKMKAAMNRIAQAVSDGILDKECVNNTTANARDKFRSSDPSAESGVFTYWAGSWKSTLMSYLDSAGLDSDLITLNPVKEAGTFKERIAPCWAITTAAENPQGIFKYFIDKMLDGGEIQTLWTYGAKGTHWDTKAETVTIQGKEDSPSTYSEGQFHYLPSPENASTYTLYNHIDPLLSIGKFTNGDPGEEVKDQVASESEAFFTANSKVISPIPYTTEYSDNISDIDTARKYVLAQVCLGYMSAEEGMAYYKNTVGTQVELVLKSLNK